MESEQPKSQILHHQQQHVRRRHRKYDDDRPGKNETEKESMDTKIPAEESSSSSSSSSSGFIFWAYFVGVVCVITSACILGSFLTIPSDAKAEFFSMPSELRAHYGKGRFVKVQIGSTAEKHTVQIFVVEEGPRNGESVMLVHGFGASSFSFRHVLTHLASRGIHAVALDLPGFGFSDKSCFQKDSRNNGFIAKIGQVYMDIKEKGLFWGFDYLLETGTMPYQQQEQEQQQHNDLQAGAHDLSQALEQAVETLGMGPVHLVLHDMGLETGCLWAMRNPLYIRSITIVDAAPWDWAVPLWFLKFPWLLEAATLLPRSLQLAFYKVCCFTSVDAYVAEAHGILLRSKNGRKAALEIGRRANMSFDLETWSASDEMKQVPMQILWGNTWSSIWRHEGQRVAELLPNASFVPHSGGRWPQEDAAVELTESIARLINTLPPTFQKIEEDSISESNKIFDSHHTHFHGDHHTHFHGDQGHDYFGAYMG